MSDTSQLFNAPIWRWSIAVAFGVCCLCFNTVLPVRTKLNRRRPHGVEDVCKPNT